MRRPILLMMIVVAMIAAQGLAAASASARQRIDMKVLLLGTSTTEPDFVSWQAALQREGVPFETIVTSPGHATITAATLSDTLANGQPEAKYQGVIVSVGALPECTSTCTPTLSQAEWTALEEYEHTFNVRQLTGDVFPGSSYGLNGPTVSGALDGTEATLTTEGKTVFPYLKGPVAMDTSTYGYEATPLTTQASGASFKTLVTGPSSSALVGVYTHPNGVQEMVETFNQNQNLLQAELLRHGALNWVTRGVYFGDQRNYYEADIDDNFLPDDSWNTATHENDYNAADALRETPTDVTFAAKWSQQNKFRMDMLFNGGGSAAYQTEHGSDPLLSAFVANKNSFGWINHTWDHPNLDIGCAAQGYIEAELNQNNSFATASLGLTASTSPTAALGNNNPSVVVTGEHSGLANLLPGNPGVVDPPNLASAEPETADVEGKLAAGSYVYAVTDDFAAGGGQSLGSVSSPATITGTEGSVTLSWEAVCHAAQFKVYREVAGSNQWKLITTISAPSQAPPNAWFASPISNTAVTGGGPQEVTYTDIGTAGSASSGPPAASESVETPYPENPSLSAAFTGAGIQYFGSDASKAYPDPSIPGSTTAAYPAGSTFTDGAAEAIPRYPTNIYYNASTEAQEVDEFNALYTPTSQGGKCVASATTTCETTPATFAGVVSDVDTNMFQHVMGNDPRPHYFHQPNIMGSPPPGPPTTGTPPATSPTVGNGLFYSVLNPLLEQYNKYFSAPIEQPTMAQIGALLAEQKAWGAANTSQVTGYIEGNQVTVNNAGTGAVNTPFTGVNGVGSAYGGITSGWSSVPVATSTRTASTAWPVEAPTVTTTSLPSGAAGSGYSQTLAASGGTSPYTWSITAGALPGGLSLNATTGAITGTPASPGISSFTVKVIDSSTPTSLSGTAQVSITTLPKPPTVLTGAASSIAQTTATLSGTVNPNSGEVSECKLEYGLTNSYGSSVPCTPSPGSGGTTVAVSGALTALSPNTTYRYRVVATNAGGSGFGGEQEFKTPPNPPAVATAAASAVAQTTATLGATVNPEGGEVSACTLEYGLTNTYGSSVACTPAPGSGVSAVVVSAPVTGLTANTSYHFRISATNSSGTSKGTDETFKTPPIPPPTVTSIEPSFGPAAGSTPVTIKGTGFLAGATITIGGAATAIEVVSETEIRATTAAGSGTQEVLVTDAGGTSAPGASFAYISPPTLTTAAASAIAQTTATLNATVNPNGGEVSACTLEYGLTNTYGSSVACTPTPGSGSSPVALSGALTGLSAANTYHFRISATNAGGTSKGSDETFKTLANCSPERFCASFTPPNIEGSFNEPSAVAVDPSGDIFVGDSAHNRVLEFNSKREFLRQFGSTGTGEGQFQGIAGIATDASGDVYVSGSARIQEFSSSGTFIRQFGSPGSGNGQFNGAGGIAIDSIGNVWVLDTFNYRIEEFSPTGEYIAKFGSRGTGAGQLGWAYGLAISGGNLYVSEFANSRVQEFSTAGTYITGWGSSGSGNGQFHGPWGIASDPTTGNLYVADTANNRIEEFSSSGAFVAAVGTAGSGAGQLSAPRAVAVNSAGNLFVADTGNIRIQEWLAGKVLGEAPSYALSFMTGNIEGSFREPNAVAVDANGNIFVGDSGHNRVLEFNSKREYVRQFGSEGSGEGQFQGIAGIATDASGDVYVSGSSRIQEFSGSGTFIRQFGSPGSANGQFNGAGAIAIDSSGNVWVLDRFNYRIEEFSGSGEYIGKFGSQGSGAGQLGWAYGLAFSAGNLYVSEFANSRVQEFSTAGTYITGWGSSGSANGQFHGPWGIASDPTTGNLYVADTANNRIEEFSSAGAFVATMGAAGSGAGQLSAPRAVAVNSAGYLLIADTGNNRIEEWLATP